MRCRRASSIVVLGAMLIGLPIAATAQSEGTLRGKISQLFILGSGTDPLVLAGSIDPNNPASIQAHGHHFVPAAVAENASLIGFITGAISTSIGSIPIGATSSGVTFRFEGGVPVKTSTSAGPIFAERAQTLGRGRAVAGIGRNSFRFSTLRGVPMDNIELIFSHENVDFAGCDEANGGQDCTQMGVPSLENEIMPFRLNLDLDVTVTTLYATYGITDRIDFGVVIPVVSTRMHGESSAQIIPFGGPNAVHFFAGTPTNPVLSATRSVSGSSLGLGDVAVRTKVSVHEAAQSSLALLGEARFATGSANDLLGAGGWSARGFAVLSGRINAFSPHLNLGYAYHARDTDRFWNDAVLATVGFDHLMTEHVTIAADVVSELQVGDSKLQLPGEVTFDTPFHRTIQPTTIPDRRDDLVNGSLGFKFTVPRGFTLVANALVPLNRGGMRPDIIYTTGLELNF
jgi:hypothetical protein